MLRDRVLVLALCIALLSACSNDDSARDRARDPGFTTTSQPASSPTVPLEPCVAADPSTWAPGGGIEVVWAYQCYFNAYASVSAADLTGDGVPDFVLDDIRDNEKRTTIAVNGVDGSPLWSAVGDLLPAATAGFSDMTGDGVQDVLVTSRGEPITADTVAAIDGVDGSLLWVAGQLDPPWQNAYTPQSIPDVDDDGVDDWLISTGGDNLRKPDVEPTIAGRLVVVSGADGSIVGSVEVPDGREIYNSPVLVSDGSRQYVLIGSGGEVFSGSFWSVPLEGVATSRPDDFRELLSGGDRTSFIAPPSVADLDGDGKEEVVVSRLDGVVYALDPLASGEDVVVWTSESPDLPPPADLTEPTTSASFTVPAIGQLDDDPALEVVVSHKVLAKESLRTGSVTKGPITYVIHDGATGAPQVSRTVVGSESVASPLVLRKGGVPTVLCDCIGQDDIAALGLWAPLSDTVEDLGVVGLNGSTPVLTTGMRPGTASLVVTVSIEDSGDHVALRIDLPDAEVEWGGYLGSDHRGHFGT